MTATETPTVDRPDRRRGRPLEPRRPLPLRRRARRRPRGRRGATPPRSPSATAGGSPTSRPARSRRPWTSSPRSTTGPAGPTPTPTSPGAPTPTTPRPAPAAATGQARRTPAIGQSTPVRRRRVGGRRARPRRGAQLEEQTALEGVPPLPRAQDRGEPSTCSDRARGKDPVREGRDRLERLEPLFRRDARRRPVHRPRRVAPAHSRPRSKLYDADRNAPPRRPAAAVTDGLEDARATRSRSCSTRSWPTRPRAPTGSAATTRGSRAGTSPTRSTTPPWARSSRP